MASWNERRKQWLAEREEAQNNASRAAEESRDRGPVTSTPFLLALVLIVLLLVGITLAAVFAPAERNVTEAQRLTDSIIDFVDAQNDGDAAKLRRTVCPDQLAQLLPGADAAAADEQYRREREAAVAEEGKTEVDGVPSGYEINGDRGVVTVPLRTEGTGATSSEQWRFVRGDDAWLVCNP